MLLTKAIELMRKVPPAWTEPQCQEIAAYAAHGSSLATEELWRLIAYLLFRATQGENIVEAFLDAKEKHDQARGRSPNPLPDLRRDYCPTCGEGKK